MRTYGPAVPYVRAMNGRGELGYPYGQAKLAYTMYAGGVGADFKLGQYLRLRGELRVPEVDQLPR